MTSPPRLAPLETMTEEQIDNARCFPEDYAHRLFDELDAQRLARARARREALEEAIEIARDCQMPTLAVRLMALRDREEA